MNIQVAVVCDAAADYSGKLNILGAFDTIFASSFPATHPQCAVALRLVFQRIEEGSHKLRMNFVDADGRFVMPSIDIPVDVVFPSDTSDLVRNFIFNNSNLIPLDNTPSILPWTDDRKPRSSSVSNNSPAHASCPVEPTVLNDGL